MDEIKQELMGQEVKSMTLAAAEHCDEGMRLYKLKQYKEAMEAFEEAIRLNGDLALPYGGKGVILLAWKRYEEALHVFELALQRDPGYRRGYLNKGYTLALLKRYKEAIEAYEKAQQLDPQDDRLPKIIVRLRRSAEWKRRNTIYRISMGLWRSYYAVVILAAGFTMALLSLRVNVFLALLIAIMTIGATIILFWKTYR